MSSKRANYQRVTRHGRSLLIPSWMKRNKKRRLSNLMVMPRSWRRGKSSSNECEICLQVWVSMRTKNGTTVSRCRTGKRVANKTNCRQWEILGQFKMSVTPYKPFPNSCPLSSLRSGSFCTARISIFLETMSAAPIPRQQSITTPSMGAS